MNRYPNVIKNYGESTDAYIRPMFSLISFLKAERISCKITSAIVLLPYLAGYGCRHRNVRETTHTVQ